MRALCSFFLSATFITGCVTFEGMRETVADRAAFDLDCPRDKIKIESLGGYLGRTLGASGCERRAVYLVSGDGFLGYTAVLNSENNKEK